MFGFRTHIPGLPKTVYEVRPHYKILKALLYCAYKQERQPDIYERDQCEDRAEADAEYAGISV